MDAKFETFMARATNELIAPSKFGLIVQSGNEGKLLNSVIAALALSGPVNVIDAGNNFDLIEVAYAIRRATQELYRIADGIKIVRAFTCIEVLRALEVQPEGTPLIVINMLATFHDQAVIDRRISLLLENCLTEINRLKKTAGVVASVSTALPSNSKRIWLLPKLTASADAIHELTNEAVITNQLRLF